MTNTKEELYAKVLHANPEGTIHTELADTLLTPFHTKARAKKNKIFNKLYTFIDKKAARKNIRHIFCKDNFLYATDGHILIRHKTDKNLKDGYYDSNGNRIEHTGGQPFVNVDALLANDTATQVKFDLNAINNINTHETIFNESSNQKHVIVIKIGSYKYQLKFLKKIYSYFGKDTEGLIFSQQKQGLLYVKNKNIDSIVYMPFKQN